MPARSDIVLYGATGFTGRQALAYLLKHRGRELGRWAIAGRSRAKLEALAATVPAEVSTPQIVIADSGDAGAVGRMIAGSKVIANLAGPYAAHGETFIAACVAHRTHYLDLTGETFWVREMILAHHAAARRRKLRIIPCAGYEALPFDFAARLAVQALRERYDIACHEVRVVAEITGRLGPGDMLSGGTVGTMKVLLGHGASGCERDMACLVPGTPDEDEVRARNRLDLMPRYERALRTWTAPLAPAPFINPAVVLRTRALLEGTPEAYGPEFAYREAMSLSAVPPLPGARLWAAAATAIGYRQFYALLESPWRGPRDALRALIERLGPASGEGPRPKALDGSGYRLHVTASGRHDERVQGTVEGRGHPGYRSTANIVAEAALALAHDELPAVFGVVTPAAGLGLGILPRLAEAGLTFDFDASARPGARRGRGRG